MVCKIETVSTAWLTYDLQVGMFRVEHFRCDAVAIQNAVVQDPQGLVKDVSGERPVVELWDSWGHGVLSKRFSLGQRGLQILERSVYSELPLLQSPLGPVEYF